MSPPTNAVRTISQEAFDELVKENMDDLGMDPAESLQDAIETLTLQGVDLSGIVTCVPGEGGVDDNPVIQCLNKLKAFPKDQNLDSVARLFENLAELCSVQVSGNAAIATKNGAVELICSLCSEIQIEQEKALVSTLKAMSSVLHDLQSTETFRASGGPSIVVNILNGGVQNLDILNSGFAVVAAAVTGNEVLKDEFMELKIDELILHALNRPGEGSIQSLYDAIRVLLTPDDNRVLASQCFPGKPLNALNKVYGYARKFAKIGIAEALVASLQTELSSPSLVSASIALKAVADEICRSIAENGGIDALLRCIDDSGEQGNKSVARVCCSLLSKVMSIISILSLRSPERAARAMEAGSGDLAIQAMQKFPAAQQMQKSACLMIRNLVARNPENRTILLNNGVEKHIRKTKQNHEFCREAATDALRDLGLDDYNS
ncbi:hypothetical protein G4B88_030751 [Cannabis sativa]|uniref:Armadillo repeat-containing protein 6 n=1 Tax=Cannabis sativa TaxID=3483 RepID=A0A7J6HAL0_CANSA|nr:hypothetical protein G4B88_030751 [Cannabis sativa]